MKKLFCSLLCCLLVLPLFAQEPAVPLTLEDSINIIIQALDSISKDPVASARLDSLNNIRLTFKGIPIDGDASAFVQKLQAKGLKEARRLEDRGYVLKGTFAGYGDCDIFVYPTPQNIVYKVRVCLPEHKTYDSNWERLRIQYDRLVNIYKDKYGEPFDSKRSFDICYSCEPSLYYVQDGKCHYNSTWIVGLFSGQINMWISSLGCVMIDYEDYHNSNLNDAAIQDEI